MTRRLLTFFGLPLAAQVMPTKPIVCGPDGCREALTVIKSRKPANGECPVCGTVAEKYIWQPDRFCSSSVIVNADGSLQDTCSPPPSMKRIVIVDCAHCRNAFYQDAEVTK